VVNAPIWKEFLPGVQKTMKDGKQIIFIADDEPEIREILSLLTSQCYDVITAENGTQAESLACADVDLYILDVNMPGQSGLLAAAAIRKRFDTPIIFLGSTPTIDIEPKLLIIVEMACRPHNYYNEEIFIVIILRWPPG
jgi:response regulator RpfG family c-di-GMP phosphodiesterase